MPNSAPLSVFLSRYDFAAIASCFGHAGKMKPMLVSTLTHGFV